MGLFDGMLGIASKVDPAAVQQEFANILAPGETVQHAHQLIRDYFVFDDKRFVLVEDDLYGSSDVVERRRLLYLERLVNECRYAPMRWAAVFSSST